MPRTSDKRERLLGAARRLIHERGFNQTSLADIAAAADVPLGNVYYYFKTKQALASAVISRQAQDFAQLEQDLAKITEARARIEGFLSMLLVNSGQIAAYGCPIGSLCTELNKADSGISNQAEDLLQHQLDWLTEQFAALGKGDEAQDLATQMLVQLQGASVLAHAFHDQTLLAQQIAQLRNWLNGQTARISI